MTDPILDKFRAGMTSSVLAGSSSHMQLYLLLKMHDELVNIRELLAGAESVFEDEPDDQPADAA